MKGRAFCVKCGVVVVDAQEDVSECPHCGFCTVVRHCCLARERSVESSSTNVENRSLFDLVGTHTLTGIWRGMLESSASGYGEDATVVVIEIDGAHWLFQEDQTDDYRSMLQDVKIVTDFAESLAPINPPMVVEFRKRCSIMSDEPDLVYGVNEATGLVVLEIGTDHTYDYYPSFVFDWNPLGSTPKWLEGSP